MPRFANLIIRRIIAHQIFERDENREIVTPRYNTGLTTLDDEGLNELQDRIINAIGNNSHSVELDITNVETNSTFSLVTEMLHSENNVFIERSKQIALKLAEAQTSRRIPGGIVVVFDGTIGADSKRFLGIIKAETHGGFSLESNDNHFLLIHLNKLLLTPTQKLYKIGIFIEQENEHFADPPRQANEFTAIVYDYNITVSSRTGLAIYFYQAFLGCSIQSNNKKLTKDFYHLTVDFITSQSISDEKKVDLNFALYSYLKISNRNTVSTSEFAEEYFDTEMRDNYLNYMNSKNFPCQSVAKDLTLLKNKLKRRKIKFSSDVRITGPSDNFNNLVEIMRHEDTKTIIKIEGRIKEQY
jgi:hypothetical protein